jgi:hypothetical protein
MSISRLSSTSLCGGRGAHLPQLVLVGCCYARHIRVLVVGREVVWWLGASKAAALDFNNYPQAGSHSCKITANMGGICGTPNSCGIILRVMKKKILDYKNDNNPQYCTISIDSAGGVTCDTAVAFWHSGHLRCDLWQTEFSTRILIEFFSMKGIARWCGKKNILNHFSHATKVKVTCDIDQN